MADSNEPKKDTVRIDLPPQSGSQRSGPDTKSRETVRIHLDLRQPLDPAQPGKLVEVADTPSPHTPAEPSPVSTPPAQVLPSPEVSPPLSVAPQLSMEPSGIHAPLPGAISPSPKKETARIPHMPDPSSKAVPAVRMKKTQPLIAMPLVAPKRTSIAVTPTEKSVTPLCWGLLGVSAIILIIQIWTYFS
jgi:hypothetical protein